MIEFRSSAVDSTLAPNLLPTCSREVGRQRVEFFLATGWTQPADPPAYPKVLAVLYSDEIV